MSGSSSSGDSKGGGVPKWGEPIFRNKALPFGMQAFDNANVSGGPLRTGVDDTLSRVLSPNYTDPNSNPHLQGVVNAMSRAGDEAWNRYDNQLAAGQSRTGSLFSTSGQKVRSEAAGNFANDLSDRVSALYDNFFQTSRNQQLGALPLAINQSQYDLSLAERIMNALKGVQRSKSDSDSASGGI